MDRHHAPCEITFESATIQMILINRACAPGRRTPFLRRQGTPSRYGKGPRVRSPRARVFDFCGRDPSHAPPKSPLSSRKQAKNALLRSFTILHHPSPSVTILHHPSPLCQPARRAHPPRPSSARRGNTQCALHHMRYAIRHTPRVAAIDRPSETSLTPPSPAAIILAC